MKKIKIKIQSTSDVITNSSSEVYLVKTNISAQQFREMWDKQLKEWKITEEEFYTPELDFTYRGEIYEAGDGWLYLSYDILCNIDQNIEGKLIEWFGRENVKVEE